MRLLALFFLFSFASCDRDPFVEYKVKYEKKAEDCTAVAGNMKMISNFGGNRFEFEKCLPVDENLRTIQTERKGDTVWIQFAKVATGQVAANFAVTLDIDSYPKYNFVTIDDMTYQLGEAEY